MLSWVPCGNERAHLVNHAGSPASFLSLLPSAISRDQDRLPLDRLTRVVAYFTCLSFRGYLAIGVTMSLRNMSAPHPHTHTHSAARSITPLSHPVHLSGLLNGSVPGGCWREAGLLPISAGQEGKYIAAFTSEILLLFLCLLTLFFDLFHFYNLIL